jgi:ribosomal protein S8
MKIVSDILTRVRNAQRANLQYLEVPNTKMVLSIVELLYREGYIISYYIKLDSDNNKKNKLLSKNFIGQSINFKQKEYEFVDLYRFITKELFFKKNKKVVLDSYNKGLTGLSLLKFLKNLDDLSKVLFFLVFLENPSSFFLLLNNSTNRNHFNKLTMKDGNSFNRTSVAKVFSRDRQSNVFQNEIILNQCIKILKLNNKDLEIFENDKKSFNKYIENATYKYMKNQISGGDVTDSGNWSEILELKDKYIKEKGDSKLLNQDKTFDRYENNLFNYRKKLVICLKTNGIRRIQVISKSSRRIYMSLNDIHNFLSTSSLSGGKQFKGCSLPYSYNTTLLLSTSKGVLTHNEALRLNLGGEALAFIV